MNCTRGTREDNSYFFGSYHELKTVKSYLLAILLIDAGKKNRWSFLCTKCKL